MKEIYVIWPSNGAVEPRGVSSLHATIEACEAIGYANSADRVRACDYIVITSGNDLNEAGEREHYLAEITGVVSPSTFPKTQGGKSRIDVKFCNPKKISCTTLDGRKWGSNNTRFFPTMPAHRVHRIK